MALRFNQCEEIKSFLRTTSTIIDLYESKKPEFINNVINWFKSAETILENNRLHIVSQVGACRGNLLAAQRGIFSDGDTLKGRLTKRKNCEGVAIRMLTDSVELINATIDSDVKRFEDADKLCQIIVAIADAKQLFATIQLIPSHEHRMASIDAACTTDQDIATHMFNLKAIVHKQDALILLEQGISRNDMA